MGYTLITGATGGLGRAFCEICAGQGDPLFLTGRDSGRLSALADELREKYGADVQFKACQLHDEKSREELFGHIREEGVLISRLINVAGADIQKGFEEYTQEKIVFQSRVNFEAAVSMARFALERRDGHLEILSVSSVSGIYPMPYFALYSATKKAMEQFFSALHVEMKGKDVNVTTVLPGAMPTRPDVCEQIRGQGLWGKLAAKSSGYVAEKSLRAVGKNRRKYIPGAANRLMAVCTSVLPLSLKMKFIANRWSKISKDAF